MKTLFSNPPWWVEEKNNNWTAGVRAGSRWPFTMSVRSSPDRLVLADYSPYPFFLGFAASYARAAGFDVVMRDSLALRESYRSWLDFIDAGNFTHIVIESATPSWEHDQSWIQALREKFPYTKIILTGPIVTARGHEVLGSDLAHAAVEGEYEKGVVRVLRGESGFLRRDLLTVEEMNTAPYPWLDDTHAYLYFDSNPRGQRWPHLQAWSSRGCWAKCLFCIWPASMTGDDPDGTGKRYVRHYTPQCLESYLSAAVARYQYRSIYFDDDLFNTSDRHVLNVCPVMQKIGLPWFAMCRADTIKPATWEAMRDSGCLGVKIGLESGSQRVLNEIINKRLDLGQAIETLRLLRSLGMTVHGTFTVGLPGETQDEMKQTLTLIAQLYQDGLLSTHQLSGTACIEGSPLHTLMQRGELAKYPSAEKEGFDTDADGARKVQRLALTMAEGR